MKKRTPKRKTSEAGDRKAGDVAPQTSRPGALREQMAKRLGRPDWGKESVRDYSDIDRLGIDPETIAALESEGLVLQWSTESVAGKPFPKILSDAAKNGFYPVVKGDLGGLVDHLAPDVKVGEGIRIDECVLICGPSGNANRLLAQQRWAAADQKAQIEASIFGKELAGIRRDAAAHPSVRNSVRKDRERIEIPKD